MDQEFTKLKDIIADVLNVDPEEILTAEVLMTIVGGKIVYEA